MSTAPTPLVAAGFRGQYDLAFQISPIILQGGIVSNAQGGLGLLTNFMPAPASDGTPFARFLPVPSGTIISQAIGMYPFANQQVAANATIQQPKTISLLMIAPVNQAGGYLSKLSAFMALQQTLEQHNAEGGTYIIATPAFIYNPVVMLTMTDITAEDDRQKQVEWQLDFIQPVLTLAGAAAAQNALIQKLTNGGSFTGPPGWTQDPTAYPATFGGVAAALGTFYSSGQNSSSNNGGGGPSGNGPQQ